MGVLVALGRKRVNSRVGQRITVEGAGELFGFEREVLAVLLEGLLQLAGVEPVAFAFRALVDLEIGSQEW